MTTSSATVAVLGLGRMGAAMARRLTARGWAVTGWTRSSGAAAAPVVREADIVVLALFDGPACDQVLAECAPHLAAPTVVVNTATVAPDEAASLEEVVLATGAGYVHAPVIGSVPAVGAGSVTVLAGCSSTDLGAAEGLLADLGEVVRAGGAADAAALKLVANSALGGAVLALQDSRRYAAELGVPDETALDVLGRSALGGLVPRGRDGRAPAHFTTAALAKDLALLAAEASSARTLAERVAGALASGDVTPDAGVFTLTAPTPATTPAPAVPDDVLEPLLAYQRGHATGDPAHFRRAFLPTAHVEGLRDGAFVSWDLEAYCALFDGEPAADEPDRRRRIEQVRVDGTVATATMTLWHGTDTFTDSFVLLRVDDGWRIANKVYHRSRPRRPRSRSASRPGAASAG